MIRVTCIILLGGRTGRDGMRWSNRFFKSTYDESRSMYAVQKYRKVMHRQNERFRDCSEEKKSARSLRNVMTLVQVVYPLRLVNLQTVLQVDLDKVPKKYAGLDGTELAISESQERMAVVVASKRCRIRCLAFAEEENLEAVVVAEVTKEPRLVLVMERQSNR